MDIIIFGAGHIGRRYGRSILDSPDKGVRIIAFADNDRALQGRTLMGVPVIDPAEIPEKRFDKIVVSTLVLTWLEEVLAQLKALGVEKEKTELLLHSFNIYDENDPRIIWTRHFAGYVYLKQIPGNVAECGVYRGDFSFYLNKYFPDRHLYLFDSFSGFSESDLAFERSLGPKADLADRFCAELPFNDTSLEILKRKLPHPEVCRIKPGHFPETAAGLEDSFCFVCLDMDLYKPTLAGLDFFWDKMVPGGVILVHDFFHPQLPGVAQAADVFFQRTKAQGLPIADGCSLAVVKV